MYIQQHQDFCTVYETGVSWYVHVLLPAHTFNRRLIAPKAVFVFTISHHALSWPGAGIGTDGVPYVEFVLNGVNVFASLRSTRFCLVRRRHGTTREFRT